MKTMTKLAFGALICTSVPVYLTGCETPGIVLDVKGTVDENGKTRIEGILHIPIGGGSGGHLLAPPSDPPVGLQHLGTYIEGKQIVDIFIDPPTGNQWMQDGGGGYHLVYSGVYDLGGGGNINVNPVNLVQYTMPATIAFDEATDSATMDFIFPSALAYDYVAAIDMPFLVQENTVMLPNGDYSIEYTGSINDVLGAMWWLGFLEIEFKHNVAGLVDANWSSSSNVVTINTSIESRMIVLEFTAPNNLP